jgi:hypothetical protein
MNKFKLNQKQLKICALIFMIIDHTGAFLFPEYRILRYIGRLSFPIYCFLLTEGFHYTKNVYRYFYVMLLFAVISEIPYDMVAHGSILEFSNQNVFFTLATGIGLMYFDKKYKNTSYSVLPFVIASAIALVGGFDYSVYGIIMIYSFYTFRDNKNLMFFSVAITNIVMGIGGTGSQKYAVLAFLLIFLYSGEKGGNKKSACTAASTYKNINKIRKYSKYIFYILYPIHLIILYCLKTFL